MPEFRLIDQDKRTDTMRLGQTETNPYRAGMKMAKKEGGFTLLEVLIAVSIFSIGLLAIAAMQTSSIRTNSVAGQITARITWGQDKLEELLARPFDHGDLDSAGNPHQETTGDGYTITWNIIDDDPITGTKRINITVAGRGKTTRLVGIKSQSI